MAAHLDHICVVAPSLAVGAAYVKDVLGVAAGPGRTHPNMGTHNLLLALGPSAYLEVISIDPQAPPVTRARWFGLNDVLPDAAPRLAAWVASTDDIANATTPELGEVETMQREAHTWQMTVRSDGSVPLGGAAPLLIARAPGANPVAALAQSGLLLRKLRIQHPDPARVLAVLRRIALAPEPIVTVAQSDRCSLVAEIQTPFGLRQLG